MGLLNRIKISYRWRLFLPTVFLTWVIIGCSIAWEYSRMRDFRTEVIRNELELVDSRIIYAYDRDLDVHEFVEFMNQYFETSFLKGVYVTVYGEHNAIIAHLNTAIPYQDELFREGPIEESDYGKVKIPGLSDSEKIFYLQTSISRDGSIKVMTAMPDTPAIQRITSPSDMLWILAIGLTLLATIVVYFSTAFLTRNITLLRKFTSAAAEGKPIKDVEKLPHDEIGEISREIFRIYEQRIAAIEKSNREHRIALHAVEEKARMRRQLTNNINHELKTPIGVIRGYLDTVLDNPDMDDATRHHFLTRTLQNVERLCTLMNDVSTMTRLEEGADNIPLSDVNMHDLLYAIENDIEASHLAGDMKFSFNVPLDCHVQGNQNLISGLIMNLTKNAAMHSHGTQMTFSLVSESPKYYVFAFADNGSGVAPEHLPHLFERFYRVDTGRSRKVGGTGLGLPIVKNTITSLGGTISVHNRSTGGLEFVFSLRKWE